MHLDVAPRLALGLALPLGAALVPTSAQAGAQRGGGYLRAGLSELQPADTTVQYEDSFHADGDVADVPVIMASSWPVDLELGLESYFYAGYWEFGGNQAFGFGPGVGLGLRAAGAGGKVGLGTGVHTGLELMYKVGRVHFMAGFNGGIGFNQLPRIASLGPMPEDPPEETGEPPTTWKFLDRYPQGTDLGLIHLDVPLLPVGRIGFRPTDKLLLVLSAGYRLTPMSVDAVNVSGVESSGGQGSVPDSGWERTPGLAMDGLFFELAVQDFVLKGKHAD